MRVVSINQMTAIIKLVTLIDQSLIKKTFHEYVKFRWVALLHDSPKIDDNYSAEWVFFLVNVVKEIIRILIVDMTRDRVS